MFAGDADWREIVPRAVHELHPAHGDAHYILSQETSPRGGERWSLLLVHWSEQERDGVLHLLEPLWKYGFVNSVTDLET